MNAEEYEHTRKPTEKVDVNPVLAFMVILVIPYALFFGLLMLLTGELNLLLLYEAVMDDHWAAVAKGWIIGSFILAVLGALYFSGRRTKLLLSKQETEKRKPVAGGSVAAPTSHFVIEQTSKEEAEASKSSEERYAPLDEVMTDTSEQTDESAQTEKLDKSENKEQ